MNEIYVAHQVVFNKKFNKHAYLHSEQLGCHFDNQYMVSKEVVLLTVNKDGKLCYLDTQEPCVLINPIYLQKSITLFECRFCSRYVANGMDCEQKATLKSEIMGLVNIMPISEFTKVGYIPMAISLVNEYNENVKGQFEPITDKTYTDTMIGINSGFSRIREKKDN
ncbi:MAG: hypothetical protein IJE89_04250 [Bacilli bacterium]|nr:hypothetical protein [Bacilli bacterium]